MAKITVRTEEKITGVTIELSVVEVAAMKAVVARASEAHNYGYGSAVEKLLEALKTL